MCQVLNEFKKVDVLQEQRGSELVANPLRGSRLQDGRAVHCRDRRLIQSTILNIISLGLLRRETDGKS